MYHPYQRYELLTKIYNNFTVRSNVFAIWLTVGFFEVEDESSIPVKLGAEIGRSENRHIRHRMFAIVDRTNLQMGNTTLKPPRPGVDGVTITVNPGETVNTQPNFLEVDINGAQGILNLPDDPATGFPTGINATTGLRWQVMPGTMLTVNPNTNGEETVTVYQKGTFAGGQPRLQARFFRNHGNRTALTNAAVIIRGNPGPWARYNPRGNTTVVPYFAVID
jgi:hypothetical protein